MRGATSVRSRVAEMAHRTVPGCVLAALLAMLVIAPGAGAAATGVDITTSEGQSFTGNVVNGLICPLASARITWGDGTTSDGTSDGNTAIRATHTYAEEGTDSGSVSYTYTQPQTYRCPGGTQTSSFRATVQDAPLTATGVDSTGAARRSLVAVLAHVADANPAAGANDFSAQVNWGDGSTTAGTVAAAAGGGFDVTGTHTYATAASYQITARITDVGGSTATASSTAKIAATASPPPSAAVTTPADGATYTRDETVRASYSCSPGADGGVLKPGLEGCSGPVANGSQIDTMNAGSHTFEVIATDADGQSATAMTRYTVTGPSPPRNLTLPSIDQAVRCVLAHGHRACVAIPHTYTCDPGTWEGRDPALPYQFAWYRLTADKSYVGGYRADKVATSQTYSPRAGLAKGRFAQSTLFECTVEASNSAGSTRATSPSKTLSPALLVLTQDAVDIHVTGIEVTQGIQASGCGGCIGTLPGRNGGSPFAPTRATYQGVRMAAGHFTVVRVFASFLQPANLTRLSGATARLEVFDANGSRISLLNPDTAPAALNRAQACLCVGPNERANPGASFNFLVPWQETQHHHLSFRATVTPPTGLGIGSPVQCATCKANRFDLIGVPFVTTAIVPIHPIPLTVGNVETGQSENDVFGDAQTVLPVTVQLRPYEAPLAVDAQLPVTTAQASAAVAQRASDDHLDGTQYPIGVFIDGTPGLGGSTQNGKVLYGGAPPISIVRDDRPLTSVMHEIGHGLGLVHADTGSGPAGTPNPPGLTGPHPDGTPDCGGNSNGQMGETWPGTSPLDNEGRLDSVGLDRRNWDIFRTGSLPRTILEDFPATGDKYYDFMSYCLNTNETTTGGNRPDAWISLRNWNRLIDFHPPPQALPAARDLRVRARARAASTTPLRVIATVDSAGKTSIFDVAPGQQTLGGPTAGSPYRVELRDAAGGTLTSVVPTTTAIHEDHQRPGVLLVATLPFAPATASVVVSGGGRVLTSRARSAHAPTAAILSPRPGSRVGRSKTTLVRWRAHDGDGDRLSTTVDYSYDGGSHWKVVAGNARGSSARVPSRTLSASRNARLRIRVSDGFDVATVTSGRLHAAGGPPLVRIVAGGRGGRVRADETLLLQGEAFDDAGRLLTGQQLKWYAGKRLLGRGERLTVQSLPSNTRAIRLVATDAHGRSSRATLPVQVRPVPPTFRLTLAPTHVAPKARHVRVVVASTVPALLRIAGVGHPIGRRPSAITIAIRPGHGPLRLKYSLSSRGGVMRGTYVAAR
ncbi:MAG: hypothetical protein ACR2QA_14240 [Solirubrobacteraceae bacterium]